MHNLNSITISFLILVSVSLLYFTIAIPGFGQDVLTTPDRQKVLPDNSIPGVKTVKIRYGPYVVPGMSMLANQPVMKASKPCSGDCTILKQWAGLEYPNGTTANVDSGMWLHHMVAFTGGPTKWDAVCLNNVSLPHLIVRESPHTAERYFSTGNERTAFDFNPGGVDLSSGSGYHITAEDHFKHIVDLMNMNMEKRTVYVSMSYDYLEGELPPNWNQTKTIWLGVDNCRRSEVSPPQQTGSFQIQSESWIPNFEGKILDTIGHVHDGGTIVEIMLTASEMLCRTEAKYSDIVSTEISSDEPNNSAQNHISSFTPCRNSIQNGKPADSQWVNTSQSLQVVGKYNYDLRQGIKKNGRQEKIMAVAWLLISIPREGLPRPQLMNP